jgi:Secretion system C-terminal sorting domain
MQLAPNGKIYMSVGQVISQNKYYWHVIDKPNESGIACNVLKKYNGLRFEHPVYSMPIYPNYRLYDSPGSPCDSLGIDGPPPVGLLDVQIGEKENIAVYPNPASEFIVVSLKQDESVHFTIRDAQGRVILSRDMVKTETQVNTQNLSKGVFFWDAKSSINGKQYMGKIVIIN